MVISEAVFYSGKHHLVHWGGVAVFAADSAEEGLTGLNVWEAARARESKGRAGKQEEEERAGEQLQSLSPRDAVCSVSLFTSIGSRRSTTDILWYVCELRLTSV